MRRDSCGASPEFAAFVGTCVPEFTRAAEETAAFGPDGVWEHTESDGWSSLGQYARFPSSGYVTDLGHNLTTVGWSLGVISCWRIERGALPALLASRRC